MDTLIVLKKPLRSKSQMAARSRTSYRPKRATPVAQALPPASGVTPGITQYRKPQICFVKLYQECLRNAKVQPAQFSYSPSYMQRHYNTPTKQISNESIFTCYKESAYDLRHQRDYCPPVHTPDVDLMLEVDYNTNFYNY